MDQNFLNSYYKRVLAIRLIFSKTSKAFSLIEILIVLFILAFVLALTSQRLGRKKQKVQAVFETFTRLNRRLTSASKLHHKTYRWVIQLNSKEADQYWVEKKQTAKNKPISLNENPETQEVIEPELENENAGFVIEDSFYHEPKLIPPFLDIIKVESSVWEEDYTEGLVYIYYYPKGLAQETAIQFFRPDNQGQWTLYLDPITKEIHVLKEEKSLAPGGGFE